MFRIAIVAGLLLPSALGCSKSAGNQDSVKAAAPEHIAVPGGGGRVAVPGGPATGGAGPAAKGNDEAFRLRAEEGKLAVEAPAAAAPGTEVTARVVVTPSAAFKVNTEYPTKLTIETPDGVTVAKRELKAGGADKAKGDADTFEEKSLTFTVKLTPSQAGNFTVNGSFKFAVCDADQCLPKKETIAIQVAAQ